MHHFNLTTRILCFLLLCVLPHACHGGVPVIYSTDLYHPHDDPDDHYDLATVFALPELDVKGVIIDMSNMGEIRGNQRLGKTRFEPDGVPDCSVRISGLSPGKSVKNAKLTGPREGVWLSHENPRRWLLKTQWQGNQLQVAFRHWAAGTHRVDIQFEDGAKSSVPFRVPVPNSPWSEADLEPETSNVHVIRAQEPEYTGVMTSCLKNLLESCTVVCVG